MTPTPESVLLEADRCVKCGLCLPLCPTYRVHQNESESPRGRIALIQGMLSGALDQSDQQVRDRLDHCLMCRQCESGCPSGVKYAEIMDATRVLCGSSIPLELAHRVARPVSGMLKAGRLLRRLGADKLVPGAVNRRMLELSDHTSAAETLATLYPARVDPVGTVALFTGCQGPTAEPLVLRAAIELLTLCGYAVHIPKKQVCCGAVYQHAGYAQEAESCGEENRVAFAGDALSAVVGVSSGCILQLSEHGGLDVPVREVVDLVAAELDSSHIHPLASTTDDKGTRRIGVMIPCSQKRLGGDAAVRQLLAMLPDCDTIDLNGLGCCGAAGLNMVQNPEEAGLIARPQLEEIKTVQPEVIVTSNVGCALQMRDQLGREGLSIQVQHPLELIADACR